MLKKISDIIIDTKKDKMTFCPICKNYVKSEDFDYIQNKCKNCNKDIEDDTKTTPNP